MINRRGGRFSLKFNDNLKIYITLLNWNSDIYGKLLLWEFPIIIIYLYMHVKCIYMYLYMTHNVYLHIYVYICINFIWKIKAVLLN